MHVRSHTLVLLLIVKMSRVIFFLGGGDSWGPKPLDISHVPGHCTD